MDLTEMWEEFFFALINSNLRVGADNKRINKAAQARKCTSNFQKFKLN
jgi:hypothetical protein